MVIVIAMTGYRSSKIYNTRGLTGPSPYGLVRSYESSWIKISINENRPLNFYHMKVINA